MDLNSIVYLVFVNGRQIDQYDQQVGGTLTVFRLAGLRVYQTQNEDSGEFRFVVWHGKRLLGVSYC